MPSEKDVQRAINEDEDECLNGTMGDAFRLLTEAINEFKDSLRSAFASNVENEASKDL